jgi:hypothetical protein
VYLCTKCTFTHMIQCADVGVTQAYKTTDGILIRRLFDSLLEG